jgi:hypothetical protein
VGTDAATDFEEDEAASVALSAFIFDAVAWFCCGAEVSAGVSILEDNTDVDGATTEGAGPFEGIRIRAISAGFGPLTCEVATD